MTLKTTFLFIFITLSIFIFSQNEDDKPMALRGPIYPGCESFADDNRKLYECFNTNLQKELLNQMVNFSMKSTEPKVKIWIKFSVLKDGNLRLDSISSNPKSELYEYLAQNTFNGLIEYIKRLNEKGKGMQPALASNSEPGIFEYYIPLTFYPPTERQSKRRIKKIEEWQEKMRQRMEAEKK